MRFSSITTLSYSGRLTWMILVFSPHRRPHRQCMSHSSSICHDLIRPKPNFPAELAGIFRIESKIREYSSSVCQPEKVSRFCPVSPDCNEIICCLPWKLYLFHCSSPAIDQAPCNGSQPLPFPVLLFCLFGETHTNWNNSERKKNEKKSTETMPGICEAELRPTLSYCISASTLLYTLIEWWRACIQHNKPGKFVIAKNMKRTPSKTHARVLATFLLLLRILSQEFVWLLVEKYFSSSH